MQIVLLCPPGRVSRPYRRSSAVLSLTFTITRHWQLQMSRSGVRLMLTPSEVGTSSQGHGSRYAVWWIKPLVRHSATMPNEGITYGGGGITIVTQSRVGPPTV